MKARQLRLRRKFHGVPLRKDHQVLTSYVIKGVEQSLADFKAGRYITYEEFKKKYPFK